jgi:hypothetical protein
MVEIAAAGQPRGVDKYQLCVYGPGGELVALEKLQAGRGSLVGGEGGGRMKDWR